MLKNKKDKFSIVLSSFFLNIDSSIRPIIDYLSNMKIENEVYLTLNLGFKNFDKTYLRKNIIKFLIPHDNIFISLNPNFTGLSKLWNRAISNCTHDWILVISDDICIQGDLKDFFEKIDLIIDLKKTDLILINDNFSCFLLNKKVFDNVGFFDERLIGMGEVDKDFLFKYFKFYKSSAKSLFFNQFKPLKITEYDFLNSDDIKLISEKNNNPYAGFNSEFLLKKYIKSKEGIMGPFSEKYILKDNEHNHYPYENFYRKNYNNL